MANRILAVDDNAVNLKVVSATLLHAGYEVFTAQNGLEALSIVEQVWPEVIILDVDMPEMDGYEVCRRLRANPKTSHIPVMILTVHDTLEEKVKGFESGADDYLTKPFQPAELQARIKVLLRRKFLESGGSGPQQGKVLSVFSLRGGAGVTTLATNLATGLAQIWQKQVALVDLNLTMGQSALMLNLALRNTWSDLAKIPVEEIDSEVITAVLLHHESKVDVLAAPREIGESQIVTAEIVDRVVSVLKTRYSYVVIDLPHDVSEPTLAALDLTDEILSLFAPDIASVRAMVGALELFSKLGIPGDKVRVALNWTFERKGLARKDIERVLKRPVQWIIPFAAETIVSAINLGTPPVLSVPTSPMGMLFEDFAYAVSTTEDQEKREKQPGEALARVRERERVRRQGNQL